jgi:hypothetical protein
MVASQTGCSKKNWKSCRSHPFIALDHKSLDQQQQQPCHTCGLQSIKEIDHGLYESCLSSHDLPSHFASLI